ncbi:LLM class flavin-dependent oxidoreductase [Gryllotalpicola reticulitermitis]|uniref:LLM class flavin-dependent oxidoreductase n=1 Tax=Gryllotalpicola reticulitermitis TaxID=1184153 RepID=A0ABV8QCM5_9MICO
MTSLGMIFQPSSAPERLPEAARAAEHAGLDELWVWEDCFKQSGVASVVAALAATERLRVGVGILPMPLRNVALLAMELATIERLYPRRARVGVGHGVLEWMGQAGARVASPLSLMREYVPALRGLLTGDELNVSGRYVELDRVRLTWPPESAVPVLAAAEGPKTTALVGEVADGLVLTGGWSANMVHESVDRARAAREGAGVAGAFEVVVFLMTEFGDGARERMAAEFDRWNFTGDRRYAALGSPESVAQTVLEVMAAGATTVLLQSRSDAADIDAFAENAGRVRQSVMSAVSGSPSTSA